MLFFMKTRIHNVAPDYSVIEEDQRTFSRTSSADVPTVGILLWRSQFSSVAKAFGTRSLSFVYMPIVVISRFGLGRYAL